MTACCRRCTSAELQHVLYCSTAHCNCWSLIHDIYPLSSNIISSTFRCNLSSVSVHSASWPVVAFKPQWTFRKCCLFPALEIEIENKHFLGSPVLTDGVNHSGNSRERLCSAAGFAVICSIANVICYFRNGARKFKTLCVGSGEGAQI